MLNVRKNTCKGSAVLGKYGSVCLQENSKNTCYLQLLSTCRTRSYNGKSTLQQDYGVQTGHLPVPFIYIQRSSATVYCSDFVSSLWSQFQQPYLTTSFQDVRKRNGNSNETHDHVGEILVSTTPQLQFPTCFECRKT